MTRKRTHRKYRPAEHTSWAYAIASNREMDQAHATSIMVMIRTAFERLKSGSGDDDDFDRLAAKLNVGMVRAAKIDPLAVQYMQQGAQALVAADRRKGQIGRYGFSGPQLIDIGDALDLYEQILRKSTPRQMQEATEEGMALIRSGAVIQAPPATSAPQALKH